MNPTELFLLTVFLVFAVVFYRELWQELRQRDHAVREAEFEIRRSVIESMEHDFPDGIEPEDWHMEYNDRMIETADLWWREGFLRKN